MPATAPTSATLRRVALSAAGLATVIVAWQLVAVLWFQSPSGAPGPVPPPGRVLAALLSDLGNPTYWAAFGATISSAALGFGIGVAIAIVLGVLVMIVPFLEAFANQLGVIAACLPAAAIAPVIVLLSPVGTRTVSVVLAALAVLFPTIVGILIGLRAAGRAQLDVVRALGGGRWMQVRKVRAVAAVPAVLAALKIGAPSAVLGAIVGEYFVVGVDSGLGLLIVSKQYVGDYTAMWAVAILATLAAAAGYLAVALLGRIIGPWTSTADGARR